MMKSRGDRKQRRQRAMKNQASASGTDTALYTSQNDDDRFKRLEEKMERMFQSIQFRQSGGDNQNNWYQNNRGHRGGRGGNHGRGSYRGNGRGGGTEDSNQQLQTSDGRLTCHYCFIPGHIRHLCRKRMNDERNNIYRDNVNESNYNNNSDGQANLLQENDEFFIRRRRGIKGRR